MKHLIKFMKNVLNFIELTGINNEDCAKKGLKFLLLLKFLLYEELQRVIFSVTYASYANVPVGCINGNQIY